MDERARLNQQPKRPSRQAHEGSCHIFSQAPLLHWTGNPHVQDSETSSIMGQDLRHLKIMLPQTPFGVFSELLIGCLMTYRRVRYKQKRLWTLISCTVYDFSNDRTNDPT